MTRRRVSMGDDARAARATLGPWGLAALTLIVLAAVVAAGSAWPFARDAFTRRVGDIGELEEEREERIGQYAASMEERVRQINGRSMFFPPPAPAEVAQAEQEDEEPADDGPAPAPTQYGGPDVIAVVNGTVWFGDDRRVGVGEERSGVRVVDVDGSPWTVRLEWRGVEFDVPVFERTTDRFLEKESGT